MKLFLYCSRPRTVFSIIRATSLCALVLPTATAAQTQETRLASVERGHHPNDDDKRQSRSWDDRIRHSDDDRRLDPEAALRWGYHVVRKFGREHRAQALAEFDDLASGSGFPAGETLFLLGRAHDEGRADIGIRRDEAAARDMYETAAKLGHPPSQHAFAAVLASSADAEEELESILYDYVASLGGEPLAHAALGYRYLYGIGTIQNCAQSMKHYEVAARETMRDLYAEGRGGVGRTVERTRLEERFVAGRRPVADLEEEAASYWRSAAEAGDVLSQRSMGILHHHGSRGIDQNLSVAFRWFEKAAAHDKVSGAMVGDMLMRGAGVKVDYNAAYRYFQETKEEVVSMNGLGYMYYHGLGDVERDLVKAYEFFEQAFKKDKDDSDVIFNLGMILKGGQQKESLENLKELGGKSTKGQTFPLKADGTKALSLFRAAAGLGHIEAAFQAANMYSTSYPMTAGKCQSAVYFLKKVVERGPWTQDMVEALDRVVEGDYGGALVLYSRLAEIGLEVAQSNAAWLLDSGHCGASGLDIGGQQTMGSRRNSTAEVVCQNRALRMYEHAARQGRAGANVKVGDYHYFGKAGLSVDYDKAAKRYLKASDSKHAEGLFSMGFMHQTGRGVPQDFHLAKRYFDNAVLSNSDAIPVVRLSLLLLKAQQTWIRWQTLWRSLFGQQDIATSEVVVPEKSLRSAETLALAALALLLFMVLGERARRGYLRRTSAQRNTS